MLSTLTIRQRKPQKDQAKRLVNARSISPEYMVSKYVMYCVSKGNK